MLSSYFWRNSQPQDALHPTRQKFKAIREINNNISIHTHKLASDPRELATQKAIILSALVEKLQDEFHLLSEKKPPYNDPSECVNWYNIFFKLKEILEFTAENSFSILNTERNINNGANQIGQAVLVSGGVALAGHFIIPTVGSYVAAYLVKSQLSALTAATFVSEATITSALLKAALLLDSANQKINFIKTMAGLMTVPAALTKFVNDFQDFCPQSAQYLNKLLTLVNETLNELQPMVAEELEQEAKKDFLEIKEKYFKR
jgi:hypothetical protein